MMTILKLLVNCWQFAQCYHIVKASLPINEDSIAAILVAIHIYQATRHVIWILYGKLNPRNELVFTNNVTYNVDKKIINMRLNGCFPFDDTNQMSFYLCYAE